MYYQLNLYSEPQNTPREFEPVYTVDSPMGIISKWERYSNAFRCGKLFTVAIFEFDYSINDYRVVSTVDIYEFAHLHAEKYAEYVKRSAEFNAAIDELFAAWES